jgi:membrane protein DedA with SNARE-associated domain
MPWGRFAFFNVSGGICWASSFGFGAHAVGTAIYKISEVFSVIAFILFIVIGFTLSRVIRHYEPILLRRAERGVFKSSGWRSLGDYDEKSHG